MVSVFPSNVSNRCEFVKTNVRLEKLLSARKLHLLRERDHAVNQKEGRKSASENTNKSDQRIRDETTDDEWSVDRRDDSFDESRSSAESERPTSSEIFPPDNLSVISLGNSTVKTPVR